MESGLRKEKVYSSEIKEAYVVVKATVDMPNDMEWRVGNRDEMWEEREGEPRIWMNVDEVNYRSTMDWNPIEGIEEETPEEEVNS